MDPCARVAQVGSGGRIESQGSPGGPLGGLYPEPGGGSGGGSVHIAAVSIVLDGTYDVSGGSGHSGGYGGRSSGSGGPGVFKTLEVVGAGVTTPA